MTSIREAHGEIPVHVDLAMVFLSSAYQGELDTLVEELRRHVPGLRHVVGCTGYGIVGVDGQGPREVEASYALSLTLAAVPQAEVVVRHVDHSDLPDGDAPPDRWSALLGVPAFPELPLSLVVLADPSFGAVGDLLAGLDFAFPTATKIGGLSSSSHSMGRPSTATIAWSAAHALPKPARQPSTAAGTSPSYSYGDDAPLAAPTPAPSTTAATTDASGTSSSSSGGGGGGWRCRADGVYPRRGAAVLALHGEVTMDLIIAQGCRPLTSTTWTVDKVGSLQGSGEPSRVLAMSAPGVAGGRSLPALEAFQRELQSVLSGMTEAQLRRTVSNLTVGLAPEGLKKTEALEPQEFLIRGLVGFDSEQGLVLGDAVRVGQRLRFMVRDKQGAVEDLTSHGLAYKRKQLQAMLEGNSASNPAPFGMLMFTCNGRGSELYGEDSYDARTLSSFISVPCAGFQCNGEIGKVGNATHLHGFTCAVGLLRQTSEVAVSVGEAAAAAMRQQEGQVAEGQTEEGGREGSSGPGAE